MSDFQMIQELLKEASELLQADTKTSKRKAAKKLRMLAGVADTIALTLELPK